MEQPKQRSLSAHGNLSMLLQDRLAVSTPTINRPSGAKQPVAKKARHSQPWFMLLDVCVFSASFFLPTMKRSVSKMRPPDVGRPASASIAPQSPLL